jgi:predicted ester cyclase
MEGSNMQHSHQETAEQVVMRKAVAGWGTEPGWRNVWQETCARDLVLQFCGIAEPVVGLDAVCAFNAELFEGFPALQQTITGVCVSDRDVVYRHRLVGRHAGPFLGLAPTQRDVDITGITWASVENGKVVREFYELNHDELKRQLGLQ